MIFKTMGPLVEVLKKPLLSQSPTWFSASGGSIFHLALPLFGLACDPPYLKKKDQKNHLQAAPGFPEPAITDLEYKINFKSTSRD